MKISLIQSEIAWNDPEASIQLCQPLIQEAVASGSEFAILPEMFTTGFSMPVGDTARRGYELGKRFLHTIAETHGVFSLGSLPEISSDGRILNTAYLATPSGESTSYSKVHLFSYGDETSRYSSGDTFVTATIRGLRCSIFICYDLRFSAPFTALAEETDIYLVVANWPASRREHWLTLLRARAIENQAYVAGVNRVGSGGGLEYCGDSALFAPDGTELGHLLNHPSVLTSDVVAETVTAWRKTFPALADRRSDLYRTTLRQHRAVTLKASINDR